MTVQVKAIEKSEEEHETITSTRCGYFVWKPDCLQKLNKPPYLLACIMFLVCIQGFVVNGIKNINTSTLERRFKLSSGEVAWISSSYDITAGILSIVLGYLGAFIHKPLFIAVSTIIMSCGSFTMALPHILAGTYDIGIRDIEICDISDNSTQCIGGDEEPSERTYIGVFIIGQIMHSIGGATIFTLATPLLDESVRRKDSAFYLGMMLSMTLLGPGLGFLIGGLLLQIYVDVLRVDMDDIEIAPGDPRWVGAWWIGFMAAGCAALIAGFLMACFPKELPSKEEYKSERPSETYAGIGDKETAGDNFGKNKEDIWIAVKSLARNPTYIFITISAISEYLLIGFATFIPKIIQYQLAQTPTQAAIILGAFVIPGGTLGHIVGGLIPKLLKLKLKGLMLQTVIFNFLATILMLQFLIKCDMPKIAGISVQYWNSSLSRGSAESDLDYTCNENCSCTTTSYDPICGQNSVTYFTPCHAGCLNSTETESKTEYYDCSCIAMDTALDTTLPDAVGGACEEECDWLPYFLFLFFWINFTEFAGVTGGVATGVHCVPDKQRAFAYGIQSTVTRFVGQVPSPLIFAAVFDRSCWLWQYICESRGACWVYNVDDVASGITMIGMTFKCTSCLFTFLAWYTYKPPPPEVIEEIDIKDNDVTFPEGKDSNIHMSKPEEDKKGGFGIENDAFCESSTETTQL